MELTDLFADIQGTRLAAAGVIGVVAGTVVGLFDRNKDMDSEAVKGGITTASGVPLANYSQGTFVSNIGEAVADILAARVGYEIGYGSVQRFYHKNE